MPISQFGLVLASSVSAGSASTTIQLLYDTTGPYGPIVNGNALIVTVCACAPIAENVSCVFDDGGHNAYTLDLTGTNRSAGTANPVSFWIFRANNVSGLTSGIITFTATFSASVRACIFLAEYSGISNTAPKDGIPVSAFGVSSGAYMPVGPMAVAYGTVTSIAALSSIGQHWSGGVVAYAPADTGPSVNDLVIGIFVSDGGVLSFPVTEWTSGGALGAQFVSYPLTAGSVNAYQQSGIGNGVVQLPISGIVPPGQLSFSVLNFVVSKSGRRFI